MTTEAVRYIVDAEDRATAKIHKVTDDIERQVKQVKDVGSKAKASTELVGTLANVLGGSQLGSFAGELAQVTERVSAFSEASKGAGGGSLLMKAGVLAAAGAISFKLGSAIGNAIFQTEKWKEELVLLNSEMQRLGGKSITSLSGQFDRAKQKIGLMIDPVKQEAAFEKLKQMTDKNLDGVASKIRSQKKKIGDMEEFFSRVRTSRLKLKLKSNTCVKPKRELTYFAISKRN